MSTPIFTCNACVIEFKSSDLQRYHMKTDWHRYNLKRRIANLPPVPADEFATKLQISEREQAENQVDEFGFPMLKPVKQAKHNEKNISKRLSKIKSEDANGTETSEDEKDFGLARTASDAESVASRISELTIDTVDTVETNTDFGEDSVSEYGFTSDSNYENDTAGDDVIDDGEDLSAVEFSTSRITSCIYCGAENKEIELNVKHMFHKHGLYIPERSYLINLPGLLNYLHKVIVHNYNCICCNFVGSSLESIRAHMQAKRHCRMPYETRQEREIFAQFYDFSSLEEDNTPVQKSTKPGKNISFAATEGVNDDGKSDDEAQEHDINSNYTTVAVDDTGMELTLPSGARLGHRAGQRYYRQNLPSPESSESRRAATAEDRRTVSGITEKQFKKGTKQMQQMEKRAVDEQLRKDLKRKNFLKYYKDELLQ